MTIMFQRVTKGFPTEIRTSWQQEEALNDHSEGFEGAYQLIQRGIVASSTEEDLNNFTKWVYRAQLERRISVEEHDALLQSIEARRPNRHTRAPKSIGSTAGGLYRRFARRKPQRSPDRQKSLERRRTLAGSSIMPPPLRRHYTESHRAVLCIVAEEIKRSGVCEFAIDKIAALAGVCRTSVYYALKAAQELGHITITERKRPGQKNLTNIVRVVSIDWLKWLFGNLRRYGQIAFKLVNFVNATGKKISQKQEACTLNRQQSLNIAPPEDVGRMCRSNSLLATA